MNTSPINQLDELAQALEQDGVDIDFTNYFDEAGIPRLDIQGNWWIRNIETGEEHGFIGTLVAALERLESGAYELLT